MCAICLKSPCDSRCPNAPEPPAVFTCASCDERITEGEEYAEIDGEHYHIGCLEDMSTRELLQLFGVETTSAVREDAW